MGRGGIFPKYAVTRNDGDPGHPDCKYFVLDIDHDPAAIAAAMYYADLVEQRNPALAADLRAMCRDGYMGIQCPGNKCEGQGRVRLHEQVCCICQSR